MRFRSRHMSQTQKSLLGGFAKAYDDWVKAGAPNHKPFNRSNGLCRNLLHWVEWKGLERENLSAAMSRSWGIFTSYPFGGSTAYQIEEMSGLLHHNTQRMQWIDWAKAGCKHQRAWWERDKDDVEWWMRYA
ncbi:hypothetical protein [Delftia phage PhiW-14]|uniref:Uncharacterized protein n=1 Tax=Delftia phage PhiW-14 TaxID=665032 RepID=C9DGD4_BPW14|nr:hypothetical protein DP-phiW-14_gp164 [Delftia phage PhiW-14]ACV50185.1 hypothetical protein [Delftia phage PhiW-14]